MRRAAELAATRGQPARLPLALALLALAALWTALPATGSASGDGWRPAARDAQTVPGELIVHFNTDISLPALASAAAASGLSVKKATATPRRVTMAAPPGLEAQLAEQWARNPFVSLVEPNLLRELDYVPNDQHYPHQWHLPLIQMEEAWDMSRGAGVTVAVLDSGVAYENYGSFAKAPDLDGTIFVHPYDFFDGNSHANDDHGHGTHVSGTIAQRTGNGIGTAGVAFEAAIMPIKVCGPVGGGNYACPSDAIANGVQWAVDKGADVINLSLGGSGISQAERNAFNYAESQGVMVFASAGNDNKNTLNYPAALQNVWAVGAVGFNKARASYSNYGTGENGKIMEFVAPGGDFTDLNGDGYVDGVLQNSYRHYCSNDPVNYTVFAYCFSMGTSMAAPHASGVAALIVSKYPSLTRAQVKQVLICSAEDLGAAGQDPQYGHGLIMAADALRDTNSNGVPDCLDSQASPTPTPAPPPSPSPTPSPAQTPTPTPTSTPTPGPAPTSPPSPPAEPTPSPSPTPTLDPGPVSPTPTPAVEPTATPDPPDSGTPTLAPTPHPTPTPGPTQPPQPLHPWGDVDCSGAVDVLDALVILRLAGGLLKDTGCAASPDVNCDGKVDTVDALVILRFSAGLPTTQSQGCPQLGT